MADQDPAAVWARAATNAPNTSVHGPLPFAAGSIPTSLQGLALQLGQAFRAITEAALRQVALALGAVEIFGWSPYEALVEIGDDIIDAKTNFNTLLAAFGLPTMDDVAAAMVDASNNALVAVNDLAGFVLSTGQASLTAAGAALQALIAWLTNWTSAFNLVGVTTPNQFVSSLKGLVAPVQRDVEGALSVIGDGVANIIDNANGTWSFVVQQGEADIANLVQGADGAVYTAAQIAQQVVAAANAAGVGAGQAVAAGQQMADQGIAAINGGVAQIGQGAQEFGAALTNSFTSWFNGWTGGNVAAANAAHIAAAAAAAAEAARQQVLQTNAINALTPHLYGGRGTSGLPIQSETFVGNTLPSGFTPAASIATNSAVYTTATASTDEETVSALWNTSLASTAAAGAMGPARYLFLRANAGLTDYLYLKYWCDNTTPYATVRTELGCVVGGIKYQLKTDSVTVHPVPVNLGIFGTITSETFHPDFLRWTGLLNSPQGWTLQASGNAINASGPGSYTVGTTDGDPGDPPTVSEMDSSHRRAGVGSDEAAWLANLTDWNFFDSGPTAGPGKIKVDTEESTASDTFVNLDTIHEVDINIGPSGMAWVFLTADVSNDGFVSEMSYQLSGANTRAATDSPIYRYLNPGTTLFGTITLAELETDLDEGPTLFTAKYRDDPTGGPYTSTFKNRRLSVTPL